MVEGFEDALIETDNTVIHVRWGGSGPPLLLLHGFPETHLTWHTVAPDLARDFTVVAADLRGYGASGTPPSTPDHAPYAMRALARDQIALMRRLGFTRFGVVGHDRGARGAYRLALDHPAQVARLAVLGSIPTGAALRRADRAFGLGFWVWFFLAQPAPLPEQMIAAAPHLLVDHALDTWSARPGAFPAEVRAAYVDALRDPARVHAICEGYRAAATLDYRHDEADRGRRRIGCPVLVLWSGSGPVAAWYDVLTVWRE